jgi:hypothetical protein
MRNLFAAAAALVLAVLFSLGGECGTTRVRHSTLAYDNTITVYQSDSFAVPLYFTANDTITGSFSVVGQKPIDLFVMGVYNYHHYQHDSANSVFARTDTSYADIFFSPQSADTFYFDFMNRDADSLRKVTLQLNRVYWDTTF